MIKIKHFLKPLFIKQTQKKPCNKSYIVPIFHDAIKHNIFDSTIIDVLPKIYFDENNIDGSINYLKSYLNINLK